MECVTNKLQGKASNNQEEENGRVLVLSEALGRVIEAELEGEITPHERAIFMSVIVQLLEEHF